jgi:opacity protein-like surface antigen
MKRTLNFLAILIITCGGAIVAFAQESELAVLVGGLKTGDQGLRSTSSVTAAFDGATGYEINYAHRIANAEIASLHWELMIAGVPHTGVKSTNLILPRSYSSLFFAPGLKVKLFPRGVSPYVVAGLGLGRQTASGTNLNGQPNTGDKSSTTWIINYGGGVDFPIFPHLALRGEVRDLIAGTPELNAQLFDKRQHNIFVAGGIVLRW